ncbi:hypothetical protein [Halorubrum sp. AJ67]|uniref:hypothetical protein n=1 Tax=Halorubrum sp. AJ67 TaxID=1173487 RepID=UPI0003DC71E4|nr:hypothetical protein [Halorubrum sp. AJ67]CDK40159.1 putative lipoprotein [Halorubrum sp. AJ67]
MKRRDLIAVGSLSLIAAGSGCMDLSEGESQDEPRVSMPVTVDNIRVGFDTEQVIEIFDLAGSQLPEENQEHTVRIDVTPLEQYGVNTEDLSVETTQGRYGSTEAYNNNVDTLDITDGIIDLVIRTSEDASDADPIALKLTGYQFTDVEAVTEVQYDVQSPDDHVEFRQGSFHGGKSGSKCGFALSLDGEFTLVNPQLLPPTLCPNSINTYRETQQDLYVEWLTPEADEVVIEIDISLLEEYGTIEGFTIEPLSKSRNSDEPMVWGATLENLAIDDWTISMKLVPDSGTNYASVGVQLSGINLNIGDPLRDVSYDMTIEGDADETVETESFDIVDDPPDNDH